MRFIKSNKNKIVAIIFSLLMLSFLIVELCGIYLPWYETRYPIRAGIGIIRLELLDDELVTITSGDEDMDGKLLISKSKDNLTNYLEEKNWEFQSQHGKSFSFEKNEIILNVKIDRINRDYMVFEFYS